MNVYSRTVIKSFSTRYVVAYEYKSYERKQSYHKKRRYMFPASNLIGISFLLHDT